METYDPSKVGFNFLSQIIKGFMEGTFIEVERMSDGWTSAPGAGGEVARIKNLDKRGSFTITLMQTSPGNDLMCAAAVLDELTSTGLGPVFLADKSGRVVCSAANGWIRKIPKVERGTELKGVQWIVDCDVLEIFVGGN